MKFKADENLGQWLADMLASAGHDAATVAQQGLSGRPDREIATVCTTEGRCLITLDVEFANPLIFDPKQHRGIIVFRVPSPIRLEHLRAAAQTLIEGLERAADRPQPDLNGCLWIIQPGRIRQYQPIDEPFPGNS